MKWKCFTGALLTALLLMSTTAQADSISPGQKPPRNEQSEAFVEIYKDRLVAWDDACDHAFDDVEEVVLWRYPGSGEIQGHADSRWFRDNVKPAEAFEPCYLDGEGRLWGYISYIYGQRMNWVCVSDPDNENLPANPDVAAAVDKEVSAMLWRENAPAILLVVGIVLVTGGLLYVFWVRKRGKR